MRCHRRVKMLPFLHRLSLSHSVVRSGHGLGGLVHKLHAAVGALRCTGKAVVAFQTVGHGIQHGLEAVQLILVQCAGQLGDALLVELVQAVVQLMGAVVQLALRPRSGCSRRHTGSWYRRQAVRCRPWQSGHRPQRSAHRRCTDPRWKRSTGSWKGCPSGHAHPRYPDCSHLILQLCLGGVL